MQHWKKLIITTVVLLALGLYTPIGFFLLMAVASFLTAIVAYIAEERSGGY